ncbi:MAG: hypothetical protein FJW23_09090 [Acidimicrobiia bacterium]|nr:hypothetical protein [Acidimicrobiia bacterium]
MGVNERVGALYPFACLLLLHAGPARADGLVEAVRARDLPALSVLIAGGADVNAPEPDGMTPLHWAVQLGDLEATGALLKAGALPDAATRYGITPLQLACTNGSPLVAERLLAAGADPDGVRPGGETPLMVAARTGVLPVIRLLLARGADPNAREAWKGQTALMWAAAEDHRDAVRTLLEAGAEARARSTGGLTPLHFAVRGGHVEVVSQLLDAGASPDETVRPDGAAGHAVSNSALALAILNARWDVAQFLLERGAAANAPDPRGSLLHLLAWVRRPGAAIGQSYVQPPDDAGSLAVGAALVARGADPNARIAWEETPYDTDGTVRMPADLVIGRAYLSFVGATPFYLAAKHSDVGLMRLLATAGADPTQPTFQGITPLMAAAGLGFWDGESPGPTTGVPESDTLAAVTLAVELGNDVNATTRFGDAPLVADGETLLLRLPLYVTKDPAQSMGDMRWGGSTALHGAAHRGLVPVVRYLVDRGARVNAPNDLGWTPRTVAGGFHVANNYHEPDARMIALLEELETTTGNAR